jgi:small subunit ribosomal protein S1
VSEMGWSHVANPSAVVAPGQDLTVKVLRIDDATKQIALSLKQLLADPWAAAAVTFQVGQVYQGQVERHAQFGLFVTLAPGITGLVPASESGLAREADLKKAFPVGSDITVIVLDVDVTARRLRLSVKGVGDAREAAEVRAYAAREDVAQAQSFGGSLADKLRGALKPRG